MDVDNSDLDMIMGRFRTMNTNDKDHLINEFKRLSNTQLSTEGCCFYLDLAEWNLNSALWAYYEYETAAAAAAQTSSYANNHHQISSISNSHELPEMQFLCDITIGEGESVAPNTNFVKTWRIKNTGNNRWPEGCQLRYVNGYNFTPATLTSPSSPTTTNTSFNVEIDQSIAIDLKELAPQETMDVSISLKSPQQCGIYQCQYRTYTRYNQPFGDPIWLLLNVEEGGLLGCIQQLNNVNMFSNNHNNQINRHVNNSVNSFLNQSTNNTENFSHVSTGDPNLNKPNMFRLDSNSNYLPETSQSNASNQFNNSEEEKRPDFYDDMFS
ncbi:unnamed protein product [Brachionus calyciflorus]|uniref:Nbr1 FW domain-containing protein n=1 Tax=Brachionus calyciflorus TaxID=104777 RepID=A0A813MAR1_9BILA|nr:unnamed protein product [Brachionus calyciflorus]